MLLYRVLKYVRQTSDNGTVWIASFRPIGTVKAGSLRHALEVAKTTYEGVLAVERA